MGSGREPPQRYKNKTGKKALAGPVLSNQVIRTDPGGLFPTNAKAVRFIVRRAPKSAVFSLFPPAIRSGGAVGKTGQAPEGRRSGASPQKSGRTDALPGSPFRRALAGRGRPGRSGAGGTETQPAASASGKKGIYPIIF